jgi:hypothetical protein
MTWILNPTVDTNYTTVYDAPQYLVRDFPFQEHGTPVRDGDPLEFREKVFGAWGYWSFASESRADRKFTITLPGGSTVEVRDTTPGTIEAPDPWRTTVTVTTSSETVEKVFVDSIGLQAGSVVAAGLYLDADGLVRVYCFLSRTHWFWNQQELSFGSGMLGLTASTGQSQDDLEGTVVIDPATSVAAYIDARFFHLDLLQDVRFAIPDGKTPAQRADSTLACAREPLDAWIGITYPVKAYGSPGFYWPRLFPSEAAGGSIFSAEASFSGSMEKSSANSGSPLVDAVFVPVAHSNVSSDSEANARLATVRATINGTAVDLSGDGLGFNQYQSSANVLGGACTVYAFINRKVSYSEPARNNIVQTDTYSARVLINSVDYDPFADPEVGWSVDSQSTLTAVQVEALMSGGVVTLPSQSHPVLGAVTVTLKGTG